MEKPIPKCLAIVVCETIVDDSRTHNKTLVNTFNCIFSYHFPAIHARLSLYISLTDGYGEVPVLLKFINDKDQAVLAEIPSKINFSSPLDVAELIFDVQQVPFPEAGHYTIQLFCNGNHVCERRIMAKCIEKLPDGNVRVVE